AWTEAWRRFAVHRRRRSDGYGDRDRVAKGRRLSAKLRAWRRAGNRAFVLGHVGRHVSEKRRTEIALAGVGKHAEDVCAFRRLGRDPQRPGKRSPRRYADENALLCRELLAPANCVRA